MARRIRQHVNPLGLRFLEPRAGRVRAPAHLGPDCPTDVELGCADAKFSFDLARSDAKRFVVGLDIRDKIIEDNLERVGELANLTFGYVNMNIDLDRVFGRGEVDRFHLLFPDPWLKSRHQKRRVVGLPLCTVMRRQLRSGGELHFASDVFEVALEAMFELEHPEVAALGFSNMAGAWSFWRGNPFSASSRREDTTLSRGQRVWRLRYQVSGGVSDSIVGSGSASSSTSHRS